MNKLSIKREFERAENLSPEAMAIAVETLKYGKGKKVSEKFKCFVLKNNELISFLTNLEKFKNSLYSTRFQLLFKDDFKSNNFTIDHWLTIDVFVEKGKIEFILVDAANNIRTLLYLFTTLHSFCPDALITQLSVRIQADDNCAYFALTHAGSLSKITDFHLKGTICKEKNVGDFKDYKDYAKMLIEDDRTLTERLDYQKLMNALEKVSYIPMHKIPKDFGSLFKNTQLLSDFYNIFDTSYLIRSNGQPVVDYIEKHSERDWSKPYRLHFQNKGIQHKIDKIKKPILHYLESLSESECEAIISNWKNYANNFLLSQIDSAEPQKLGKNYFFNTTEENKSKTDLKESEGSALLGHHFLISKRSSITKFS